MPVIPITKGAPTAHTHDGTIELGEIKIDARRLTRQLRNDLKDDWFPDPFAYSDMLEGGIVAKTLASNFEANHGRYVAGKSGSYNIPKPNFCLRFASETSLTDRAIYHSLTSFLVPFYDPLIPWNVFNHRIDRQRPNAAAMFKPGVPAWTTYVGVVKSCVSDPSVWLLSTDIKDYYEHINLDKLRETLIDLLPELDVSPNTKSQIRARITLIFECLEQWCTRRRGIPQNRDASSFLANVYMYPVDSKMLKSGYGDSYFRYMDDIKVVCRDEYAARKALKVLCLALRDIGLSVNSKKTELIPASDTAKVAACFDEGSAQVQQIDAMWRSRSKDVIMRSLPVLKDYTLQLIAADRMDSRNFRFCVNKLIATGRAKDIWVPNVYFSDITAHIVDNLWRQPAATDQAVRYLSSVATEAADMARVGELLCDTDKCIYHWQNFRLWALLVQKRYSEPPLLRRARQVIDVYADSPTWSGAALYLGALGEQDDRRLIARRFPEITSFLGQRSALIALHELPYKDIEGHVTPNVRNDLLNVYRGLRKKGNCYYSIPEQYPITSLIDAESEYD